jgi:hypothetical protein
MLDREAVTRDISRHLKLEHPDIGTALAVCYGEGIHLGLKIGAGAFAVFNGEYMGSQDDLN